MPQHFWPRGRCAEQALGRKPFYKERPMLAFGNAQCMEGLRDVGLHPLPPTTVSRVQFEKT